MSHSYIPVQWNRNKIFYDVVLWGFILTYIVGYLVISNLAIGGAETLSPMIVIMRALATCAFIMLTVILCIGPLSRLDERFLPLLYNRRHFGVSMFIVALAHGVLATIWYHGFGVVSPIEGIFGSPGSFTDLADFPFQPFGAIALVILLLMAATSHDFWNTNLGASFWKALHMLVYLAYGLLVIHIATGAMQNANTGFGFYLVLLSVALVGGLHIVAALVSRGTSAKVAAVASDGWLAVGRWKQIANNSASFPSLFIFAFFMVCVELS